MDNVEQVAEDSDVSKDLDASDEKDTDVWNILSLFSVPPDSQPFANSARDGSSEDALESERDTDMLSDVSTADLLQDVHEELPDDSTKMLSSEDTSPPENIKCWQRNWINQNES